MSTHQQKINTAGLSPFFGLKIQDHIPFCFDNLIFFCLGSLPTHLALFIILEMRVKLRDRLSGAVIPANPNQSPTDRSRQRSARESERSSDEFLSINVWGGFCFVSMKYIYFYAALGTKNK